jgi:hypothetical protein
MFAQKAAIIPYFRRMVWISVRTVWLDRMTRSVVLSRRLFALLCFLMLIFDVVGGLTTVWKNEISRVYTARLRIGVLVVALLAAAFVEFHGLGFRWVDHVEPKIVRGVFWVLMPVAGTLLALLTFGGFVAAIAVTSACGLSLQLHTALRNTSCCARPCRPIPRRVHCTNGHRRTTTNGFSPSSPAVSCW